MARAVRIMKRISVELEVLEGYFSKSGRMLEMALQPELSIVALIREENPFQEFVSLCAE